MHRSFRLAHAGIMLGLALLLAATAPVASASDWYTVEMVVFANRSNEGLSEEVWRRNPGWPDLAGAVDLSPDAGAALGVPGAFAPLPRRDLDITAVARQLERSGRYQVLLTTGWHQPGFPASKALRVHIHAGDPLIPATGGNGTAAPAPFVQPSGPAVDGVVRLQRSHFLHVSLDLVYYRPPAGASTAASQPATDGDVVQKLLAEQSGPPTLFRLTASRRMRSGELHYIDHPLFGVLVKVIPYSVQPELKPGAPPDAATGNAHSGETRPLTP